MMRIYLCGQKYFGALVLRMALDGGYTVVGVSAPPADVNGRPDRLWQLARAEGIPTMPAGHLRRDTLPSGVDLIVCAHAHDFLSRATRLRATHGAIGYHPSLLPLHRGRDAIKWAIKAGDRVTGGTVFWLSDTVDGGPVAAQDYCLIPPGATPDALWRETLQPMGLRLLRTVLADVAAGTLTRIPQDHRLATWEPSLNPPPLRRPDLILLGSGRPAVPTADDGTVTVGAYGGMRFPISA